jgi:anti-sigma B factor antagonist
VRTSQPKMRVTPWVGRPRVRQHLAVRSQPPPTGTAVVALPAEIDIANAGQVVSRLAAALRPGVSVVVADLTGTIFCDASGVSALVRARDRAAAAGAELRLAVPPGRVRRVLAILGMEGQLRIYPSVGQALSRPATTGAAGHPG